MSAHGAQSGAGSMSGPAGNTPVVASDYAELFHRVTEVFAGSLAWQDVIAATVDGIADRLGPDIVTAVVRTGNIEVHAHGSDLPGLLGPPTDVSELGRVPFLGASLRDGRVRWFGPGDDIPAQRWPSGGRGSTRSGGAVPFLIDGRPVGALFVVFDRLDTVRPAVRQLLTSLAVMCAEAIRRAAMHDGERRASLQRHDLYAATEAWSRSETAQQSVEAVLLALRDLVGPNGWAGAGLRDDAAGVARVTTLEPTTLTFGHFDVALDDEAWILTAVLRDGRARHYGSRAEALAEFPRSNGLTDWAQGGLEPIRVAGETVGTLSLAVRAPHRLEDSGRLLLRSLATLCGEVLHRIAIREAEQRAEARAAALRRVTEAFSRAATVGEVIESTLAAVVDVLDAESVTAVVDEGDGRILHWEAAGGDAGVTRRAVASVGELDPVTAAVLRDGRHRRYRSLAEAQAEFPGLTAAPGASGTAVVPLVVDGAATGTLGVRSAAQCPRWDDGQPFLEVLASLCAEAVRRARLYEAERRAAERFRALHGLTDAFARAATVEEVLTAAVDGLHRALGANLVAASVVRDGRLRIVHHIGRLPERNGRLPLDPPQVVRAALRDGRNRWFEADPVATPRVVAGGDGRRLRWQSGAVLPIHVDAEPVGVIGLGFPAARSLDAAERDLLQTAVDLCREALRRARDVAARIEAEAERRRLQERVAAAAEEERRRVAADLHDGPVQELAAAAIRIGTLRRTVPDGTPTADHLDDIAVDVRSAVAQLRSMMVMLHPAAVGAMPLGAAIRSVASGASSVVAVPGPEVAVEVADRLVRPLPDDLRAALLRVALEALTNVAKHAAATAVRVELAEEGDVVVLRVVDDGVGIDGDAPQRPGHLGLATMRDRMSLLGGSLSIGPADGGGTVVEARAPRPHA